MIVYGAETWTITKRVDSNTEAMEMKFLRAILNKTNKDKIKNTNIRLELGVNEIKKDKKSRLRWFGDVMRIRKERIPKKMLHTKMEGNNQEEDPEPDG